MDTKIKKSLEIIENSIEIPNYMRQISGVYFLLQDDVIVYVGKSENITLRLMTHIREKSKSFNKYYYIYYDNINEMSFMEAYYIMLLKPLYNKKEPDVKYQKEVINTLFKKQDGK